MKIAISTREQNIDSTVDTRFGRALMFALYDSKTKDCSWHENAQNYQATQGAGIQTAQNVIEMGVEAVIAGHCGPKAFRILDAAGIKVYAMKSGTDIKQAVEMVEAGTIQPLKGADVEDHWV